MALEAPITPLPVPATAPLVILVGGTFDPPHRAHVVRPVEARRRLEELDVIGERGWLVYVPAAQSPLKASPPVASDADRVEMLRLASDGVPRSSIWTDEIDRAPATAGTSYTSDTVRRARTALDAAGNQGARLRLLIGSDQAAVFHLWRDPRDILRIAEPAVMPRAPFAGAASLAAELRRTGAWSASEIDEWIGRIVDVGLDDVSATGLRSALAGPTRSAALSGGQIAPRVARFIGERGLYSSSD